MKKINLIQIGLIALLMLFSVGVHAKSSAPLSGFASLFNIRARRALVASAAATATMFSMSSFAQTVPQGNGVTAQLVQTNQGLFYQVNAFNWDLNGKKLTLIKRGSNFITLQDASLLDQYTLDLTSNVVQILKAKQTTPAQFAVISDVKEASGPGLNGISMLLQSPDRMVHIDADRYFAPAGQNASTAMTSDGSPRQWGRYIYTALGASFSQTKGPTVNRVDLNDGSLFINEGPFLNTGKNKWLRHSKDQYSWTDEWLRTPESAWIEMKRDEWSVYLMNPVDASNTVQIDLYTKKATWNRGKSSEKIVNILPEKFPFYGQFSRTLIELVDDAVFKTNTSATGSTLKTTNSSVATVNLLGNTCRVRGAGYTSCKVLLGEFTPRGITGYSMGGFSMSAVVSYQPFSIEYLDTGAEAFRGTVNGNIPGNMRPMIAQTKGRAHVQFTNGVQISLSEKIVTPQLFGNNPQTLTGLQQYFPGQTKAIFRPYPDSTTSPGFLIQNRTDHDVLVSLEQVGCLYYGIVKPGQTFYRATGAVWFTVKAAIAPDLKEPTPFTCALRPALMIATVAAAGISGGTAAVPMAMLSGMVQGAAYATTAYVESKGATELEAIAAKTAVLAVGGGLTGGLTGIVAMNNQAVPAVGKALLVGGARAIVSEMNQSKLDKLTAELTQTVSLFGQYAGYPWPWDTADRIVPIYEITGGPIRTYLQEGGVLYQYQKTPLAIRKIN